MYADAVVTINTPRGLHATPACMLAQTAMKFKSKIIIKYDRKTINAKALLLVITLGAKQGDKIFIMASGEDAEEAIKALYELIEIRNFDGE